MRKSNSLLPCLVAAFILAACGGGGGGDSGKAGSGDSVSASSSGSSAASSNSISAFTAVRPAQGDTFVYTQTVNLPNNAAPYNALYTRYFKTVNADGSSVFTLTNSGQGYSGTTSTLDSAGAQVTHVVTGGEVCNFSPSFAATIGPTPGVERVAGTYSVGTTWNYTSIANCINDGTSFSLDVTNAGVVAARESVTVHEVTFDALKEVYSVTSARRPIGTSNTRKVDYVCWRDIVLGRVIRCDVTNTSIPANSTTPVVDYTARLELLSYTANGVHGSTTTPPLTPALSGEWNVAFNGSAPGTCSPILVSVSGTVSGSCTNSSGTFATSGSVDAHGAITFSAGPTTFTGQLNNPVEGGGTWTDSNGGSGSWTASHR